MIMDFHWVEYNKALVSVNKVEMVGFKIGENIKGYHGK